jgi:hypothetical protein
MRIVYAVAIGIAVAFVIYAATGWQIIGLWLFIWVLLVVLFALVRRVAKARNERSSK